MRILLNQDHHLWIPFLQLYSLAYWEVTRKHTSEARLLMLQTKTTGCLNRMQIEHAQEVIAKMIDTSSQMASGRELVHHQSSACPQTLCSY